MDQSVPFDECSQTYDRLPIYISESNIDAFTVVCDCLRSCLLTYDALRLRYHRRPIAALTIGWAAKGCLIPTHHRRVLAEAIQVEGTGHRSDIALGAAGCIFSTKFSDFPSPTRSLRVLNFIHICPMILSAYVSSIYITYAHQILP